jgi:ribonucleoside-diphosphate reductase alpha chain
LAVTHYPELSESALDLLHARYLLKDDKGQVIETPDQLFWRVAANIAAAEREFDPVLESQVAYQFFEMMRNLYFLPNSPTLMNTGTLLGQLSACAVVGLDDSIDGIFSAVWKGAIIHKSGGGVGYDFTPLRPEGDRVNTTKGVASGPVSFLDVFNTATEVVKQGGKRRGANMAILSIHHPDILKFIQAKDLDGRFRNFNLSVALSSEFMESLVTGRMHNLINPRDGQVSGIVAAGDLFDALVGSAWKSGEPGILFMDRINLDNPTPFQGRIAATNACSEQPLLPGEFCNLGSINLARMVRGDSLDWDLLGNITELAIRFLDNVISVNRFPLPEFKQITLSNRKVGLGVMGLADMLIALDLPYNSPEAFKLAERTMKFIQAKAKAASC